MSKLSAMLDVCSCYKSTTMEIFDCEKCSRIRMVLRRSRAVVCSQSKWYVYTYRNEKEMRCVWAFRAMNYMLEHHALAVRFIHPAGDEKFFRYFLVVFRWNIFSYISCKSSRYTILDRRSFPFDGWIKHPQIILFYFFSVPIISWSSLVFFASMYVYVCVAFIYPKITTHSTTTYVLEHCEWMSYRQDAN